MAWQRRTGEQERSADPAEARVRGMSMLAGRDYASAQLYEKLCRRFTPEAAARAVAELVEIGYLDDARYAAVRAHSLRTARKSRRAAALALRGRGLTEEQIERALDEAYAPDENGEDPELAAARALVAGCYRAKLAAGRADLVRAALARRGFTHSVIRQALDDAGAADCSDLP